jgi:hypothetical protein
VIAFLAQELQGFDAITCDMQGIANLCVLERLAGQEFVAWVVLHQQDVDRCDWRRHQGILLS